MKKNTLKSYYHKKTNFAVNDSDIECTIQNAKQNDNKSHTSHILRAKPDQLIVL